MNKKGRQMREKCDHSEPSPAILEHIRLGWYFKTMTPKILLGFLLGLAVLWLEYSFI